jgi:hypothetical protein
MLSLVEINGIPSYSSRCVTVVFEYDNAWGKDVRRPIGEGSLS